MTIAFEIELNCRGGQNLICIFKKKEALGLLWDLKYMYVAGRFLRY